MIGVVSIDKNKNMRAFDNGIEVDSLNWRLNNS